jgi:uncharacterized protein YecT (DUF1311 family)
MARSAARRRVIFICLLPFLFGAATSAGHAQNRKPTAKEITAIRNCAKKYDTSDLNEVERKCPFNLVGAPSMERPEGQSNVGVADCYRLEGAIWYDLLNENYSLAADLDDEQKAKLRDMQRAWIAYRDSTCGFYYAKIQGTMAGPMTAACVARERARRAVLLQFFSSL